MSTGTVRVAAVNDYEIVVAGVADLLARYPDRVTVCDRILVGEPIENGPIDVALYDTYGRVGVAESALRHLAEHPEIAHVAVFSLDLTPALMADARRAGAHSFISKALSGDDIVDALVDVAAGKQVTALSGRDTAVPAELDWPGREDGLTQRASQDVVPLADGLTNREIAEALYLSPETVKSYLSEAYHKLGVRNRVAAAAYVQRSHAFRRAPLDPLRDT